MLIHALSRLRCDRQSPCGGCVSRGKAADCTYAFSEEERKDAIDYRPRSHARSYQARQRLVRLENLVTEMREQSGQAEAVTHGRLVQTSPRTADVGLEKLSLTEGQVVYTGSSHWVTILEDVRLLRNQ